MEKEKKDCGDIVFGYMCAPSFGFFGQSDGGFSVALYSDVKLVYKTYIFDKREKDKEELYVPTETVEQIKAVLCEHQTDIDGFQEHVDNGSLDGDGNFFIFSGKEFIVWNITYSDEDELKENNPGYYKKYVSVVKQQNMMLIIFVKIAEILERYGINLNVNKVAFDKNLKNRNCSLE